MTRELVSDVRCTEIDLMEANRVAWVSTVHVGSDGNGEDLGERYHMHLAAPRLLTLSWLS